MAQPNILEILLQKGLPSREVQVALSSSTTDATATQLYHDSLNCNGNLQVDNVDVSDANPVPVTVIPNPVTSEPEVPFVQTDDLITTAGRLVISGAALVKRIFVSYRANTNDAYFVYLTDSATAVSDTPNNMVWVFVLQCPSAETISFNIEMGINVQNGLSIWASSDYYRYEASALAYPPPVEINGSVLVVPVVEFV